jgi:predicted DNA-binding WGR domain protein
MARLTLGEARNNVSRKRPWTFRMEFHDPTANSHKFWLATGRGRHEPVEVHYGRIGSKAQIIVKDWAYVEKKATEKFAKGYRYADTPFVRIQQSTIDAHTGTKPVPTINSVRAANNQPPLPTAPKPLPPQVRAAVASAVNTVLAPTVTSSGPYAKVASVKRIDKGTWHALDASGSKVLDLTPTGARDLVAEYDHIAVAGL